MTVVCQPQMVGYADPRWLQVGVTYRMLDYWTTTGVLRCDNPSPGSGLRRLWPESEIEVAARIVRLRRVGFPLDQAVELARKGQGVHDLGHGIKLEIAHVPVPAVPAEPAPDRQSSPGTEATDAHVCAVGVHGLSRTGAMRDMRQPETAPGA